MHQWVLQNQSLSIVAPIKFLFNPKVLPQMETTIQTKEEKLRKKEGDE